MPSSSELISGGHPERNPHYAIPDRSLGTCSHDRVFTSDLPSPANALLSRRAAAPGEGAERIVQRARDLSSPLCFRPHSEGSEESLFSLFRFACALAVLFLACVPAFAQTPDYKNIGRTPTDAEVKAWNIDASPDGKGLPTGSGTAKDGAKIFAEKCAPCHTPSAEGGKLGPALVGGTGTLKSLHPVQTVGSYWPFPTTLWDYIHRAMPRGQGGSLEPDEVYSLTAFLLYRNGIVKEDDVLDAKSLPKIQMPNRQNFVPENLNDIWEHNKRACHTGTCP